MFIDATVLELFATSGHAFTTRLSAPPADVVVVLPDGARPDAVVLHDLDVV